MPLTASTSPSSELRGGEAAGPLLSAKLLLRSTFSSSSLDVPESKWPPAIASESRMRSRLHGNRNWGELSFELCRLHSVRRLVSCVIAA
ncbi:hypothetical protein PC123_g6738 [Phytophthora cactorum]|nr:hypothetical protein PC123_g6738 [Phytophthora cactorum]